MANEAALIQFRQESEEAFQRGRTFLRECVTTDTITSGGSTTFLVEGKADEMVQRGAGGDIPTGNQINTPVPVTLDEFHELQQRTGYNIFTGQGDVRRIMIKSGMNAAARHIDDKIIDTLVTATGTYASAAAQLLTSSIILDIIADLGEGDVTLGDDIAFLWTPKAWGRLFDDTKFSSIDYNGRKPLSGGAGRDPMTDFIGAKHIMHTGLPGMGTATATCFAFSKKAVGHAISSAGIQSEADYEKKQDRSWSRHTIYDGSAILQNAGILKITHDDTIAVGATS